MTRRLPPPGVPDPFAWPVDCKSDEELAEDLRREELRRSAQDAARVVNSHGPSGDLIDALIYGANKIYESGKDPERRIEVDITGLDFEAVKRTIDMMPGGCELMRDGDRVYVVGIDPEFVVWGATKQGYIRGRKS